MDLPLGLIILKNCYVPTTVLEGKRKKPDVQAQGFFLFPEGSILTELFLCDTMGSRKGGEL